MNETLKLLQSRKSVRSYSDVKITKEEKEAIINGAINAPSAGNMQLYSIIDVTNKQLKEKLSVLCDNQPFIAKADMVLIFCADYQKWYNAFTQLQLDARHPASGDMLLAIEDACIAAQNAVTAAESLGVGSCFIGDIMENMEEVTALLNLPDFVYPACMLVFGHPDQSQIEREKPRRVDNKYVVFENSYRQLNAQESEDMLSYKSLKPYKEYMSWFMNWKYNSEFSKEMSRSADKYLDRFNGKK